MPASKASTRSSSSSRAESSRITIRFRSAVSIDSATSDVRDRVSRVRRSLPDDITEPTIAKVEADAQPIIFLIVRSSTMNALALTDYVDRFVVDRFKNLDGVADVSVNGDRRYAMRVWIDHQKLAGLGLTVQDVETAIRARTPKFRRAASKAPSANSPCCRAPALGTAGRIRARSS